MKAVIHMAAECLLFEELSPDEFEAALMKFSELVRADEREAIYKMVLLDTLKDPDLLMPESEVDDNDADDYFKSSEFRYAMNNVVKSTIFTITANIRARGNT